MKYPQLVHMPGDVEHWLEKKLEARGISIICAKYILNLVAQVNTSPSMECFPCDTHRYDKYGSKTYFQAYGNRQSWEFDSRRLGVVHYPMSALKEKCDIEKFVDELCVKLKEIENNGVPLFDISTDFGNDITRTNAPLIYSEEGLSGNVINVNEAQTFPQINSIWTRGLLHDSEPVKDQNKMEDYFSSLFYENPSDNFGFEFTRLKSEERQDGKERDRITYYNKQNLLSSECTERLYERNTDIDKLIAKFDANIEGIWKPPYEPDDYEKYETLLSENILANTYFQNGSSLIWSFGNDSSSNEKLDKYGRDNNNIEDYKPTLPEWSKFSSPVITSSSSALAMFNPANLNHFQKWSSMDGRNDTNVFLNHKRHESCFTEVVPKFPGRGVNRKFHPVYAEDRGLANVDEEDLLTSAKTHFRPIRMEEMQANQTVAYEDGTTFDISNELEKVTFTRSNSGVLYLDAESELETPRKYMEYKEREISARLFDSESDLSVMEEFVPKFRVRQSNEKCCQTEEVVEDVQIVPSLNETDCDSDSYECEGDEFFFPGDSELAENLIGKMEDDGKFDMKRMKSDCNCNDIYVAEGLDFFKKMSGGGVSHCACTSGNLWPAAVNESEPRQEWSDIWCPDGAYDASGDGLPTKEEYFRFREELTREGEQLLSDLSCLQMLYSSSKWIDDESASDCNEDESLSGVFCPGEFPDGIRSGDPDGERMDYRKVDASSKSRSNEGAPGLEGGKFMKANEKNLTLKLAEIRERAVVGDKSQKEGKRRNSTSQKIFSLRQCQRFSFGEPAIPLLFPVGVSHMKEDSYEMSKGFKRRLSF